MALVTLREVTRALDVCAPGYTLRETPHRIKVYYNGLEGLLPNGGHGPNEIKTTREVRQLGSSSAWKEKSVASEGT